MPAITKSLLPTLVACNQHWLSGFVIIVGSLSCKVTTAQQSQPIADSFISHHWLQPINAQNQQLLPPSHALMPQACGQCHQAQYKDWQQSLHAKAMGAGVLGQLADDDPASIKKQRCLQCHAPLAQQQQALTDASQLPLLHQGIVCASCHVRKNRWFGPLSLSTATLSTKSNHHKSQPQAAFSTSANCASCHQFPADGPALEGKLLQNTYIEWQNSPFGEQSEHTIHCQGCHMPNRRHLWQGIHNKDMVLSGLTITTNLTPNAKNIMATLKVTNTGVGHYFPTYLTPAVLLQGFQQDANGNLIAQTTMTYEIMRSVSLDLSIEYFDTRLAPQQSTSLEYDMAKHHDAKSLILQIKVEPDWFYHQFYQSLIKQQPNHQGIAQLRQAKQTSSQSGYLLFQRQISL